jgi:ribosomal protein S18 acetylase RimI-like enzyme
MNAIRVRNYDKEDMEQLAHFLGKYAGIYPDAKLFSAGFYTYHPALKDGNNSFCVQDQDRNLIGFAPLAPAPAHDDCPPDEPHHLWTVLLADPEMDDPHQIRELLFQQILKRVDSLKQTLTDRRVRLAAEYVIAQRPEIDHLLEKGFEHYESEYFMRRDLSEPLTDVPVPANVTITSWKMLSEEEQRQYLDAYHKCFPEILKTQEKLQFLLDSPSWESGKAITAFDQHHQIVASILAYRDEEQQCGVCDDVFVLPEWRRQGLAKALINEGLKYFQTCGIKDVRLEVKRSNFPAVSLYKSMSYTIANEQVLLGKYL